MDELETRMRGGLTQLVEPVSDLPELDAVVTRGRQLRARRRIGVVAGGAAALALVAGFGWAGTSLLHRSESPIVATPSVSASAAIPIGATAEAHIALPPDLGQGYGIYDIRFLATKTLTGIDLKATSISETDQFTHGEVDQDKNPAGFGLEQGQIRVGLLTDRVDWLDAVGKGDLFGFQSFTAELPGWGATVYVVVPRKGVALDSLAAMTWRGSDGQMRWVDTSRGPLGSETKVMPTAQFQLDGHTGTLASLEHFDLLALADYDGLGYQMNVREAQGGCRFAGSSEQAPGGSEVWQSLAICPLPIGATQISATPGPGVAAGKTLMVGDRPVVVIAADRGKLGQIVTSLSYTDGTGKQITHEIH